MIRNLIPFARKYTTNSLRKPITLKYVKKNIYYFLENKDIPVSEYISSYGVRKLLYSYRNNDFNRYFRNDTKDFQEVKLINTSELKLVLRYLPENYQFNIPNHKNSIYKVLNGELIYHKYHNLSENKSYTSNILKKNQLDNNRNLNKLILNNENKKKGAVTLHIEEPLIASYFN